MAHPWLRSSAARVRAVQTFLLHRAVLRRASRPVSVNDQPCLVVAPHHDDETFACGGMIALKRQRSVPVHIVVVTDGSQAHASLQGESGKISASRREELTTAARRLGVPAGNLDFLEGPDGRMSSLTEQERAALVSRLASVIRRSGATEIYVPHCHDRHADHEAVYRLTMEALAAAETAMDVLEYPVWILWKRTPLEWRLREIWGAERLDVSSVQQIKNEAIEAYCSQLPAMPAGFLPQFRRGEEYFWRSRFLPPTPLPGSSGPAAMVS